jgi:hypothetical protein
VVKSPAASASSGNERRTWLASARSPWYIRALPSHRRQFLDKNRSPSASARSRPSSAAARSAVGSPVISAMIAVHVRIWHSVHRSPAARTVSIASARYGRATSVL